MIMASTSPPPCTHVGHQWPRAGRAYSTASVQNRGYKCRLHAANELYVTTTEPAAEATAQCFLRSSACPARRNCVPLNNRALGQSNRGALAALTKSVVLLLFSLLLTGLSSVDAGSCYDSYEKSESYGKVMCGGEGAATDAVTYYTTYAYQSSYQCTYYYTTYST